MHRALRATPELAPWWNTLRQVGDGELVALEEIGQDVAGSHTRQLVWIPGEEQVCSRSDGFSKLVGQQNIQHADLIDDHQIRLQGGLRVPSGLEARSSLEETMQPARRPPRGLFHPFGGAPSWRRRQAAQALGPSECQHRPQGVRLTGPPNRAALDGPLFLRWGWSESLMREAGQELLE
jgi:hypothetical protein